MNHAKTSKNMKNHEIMPSGTPEKLTFKLFSHFFVVPQKIL